MLIVQIGYTMYSEVACLRSYSMIISAQINSDLTISHSDKGILLPKCPSVSFVYMEFRNLVIFVQYIILLLFETDDG